MIHFEEFQKTYQEAKFGRLGILWTFICRHSEVLGVFFSSNGKNRSIHQRRAMVLKPKQRARGGGGGVGWWQFQLVGTGRIWIKSFKINQSFKTSFGFFWGMCLFFCLDRWSANGWFGLGWWFGFCGSYWNGPSLGDTLSFRDVKKLSFLRLFWVWNPPFNSYHSDKN